MTAAVAPLPKRQNEPNWSQLFQKEEREREKKKKIFNSPIENKEFQI